MNNARFTREWFGFNFAGWIIGDIIYAIIYQPYLLFSLQKNPELKIAFLLLICIGIASIQWFRLRLKDWKIQLIPWILITSVGWGTSVSIVGGFSVNLIQFRNFIWLAVCLYMAGIFTLGAIIGIIQAVTIRKSLARPELWILANGFGLLTLGLYVIGINIFVATFRSPIAHILNSIGFYTYSHGGRTLLLLFIWITLPLIGTLTTAIPISMILSRYGIRHSSSARGSAQNPITG